MRRMRLCALTLAMLVAAAGAIFATRLAQTTVRRASSAVNPLFDVRSQNASPFPSDRFTVGEDENLTRRRVNLPLPSDCVARRSDCEDVRVLNELDGFSLRPLVSIAFDRPIDPASHQPPSGATPHDRAITHTDHGLRRLARLPRLKHLDVSGTAITDRGLAVLRDLPALETLSLAGTRITDEGVVHLADCHELRRVHLGCTRTGDGAIRALAGKAKLHDFASGNDLTDAGIALLHELPVYKSWHGGEPKMALLSYHSAPNHLTLRGSFTDRGMEQMRGLDGLFGLNIDDRNLAITAVALEPLVSLPHLGWLGVDAKDDWMPHIAAMPRLRFLARRTPWRATTGLPCARPPQSAPGTRSPRVGRRRCAGRRAVGVRMFQDVEQVAALDVEDDVSNPMPRSVLSFAFFASSQSKYFAYWRIA
jgi:Leucine Rich repeat